MTTSSLDLRYGRQGGRIVPWIDRKLPALEVGTRHRLDLGSYGNEVVTITKQHSGDRYTVSFHGEVSRLIAPRAFLTPLLGTSE